MFDVPDDLPEEDIRHSLYKFNSVVEVVRLVVFYSKPSQAQNEGEGGGSEREGSSVVKDSSPRIASRTNQNSNFPAPTGTTTPKSPKVPPKIDEQDVVNLASKESPPAPIRITLASVEEYTFLIQNGLNFYGATFFPTESNLPATAARIATKKGRQVQRELVNSSAHAHPFSSLFSRLVDGSIPGRVRELLPVFDACGFTKLPAPASKTFKPRP